MGIDTLGQAMTEAFNLWKRDSCTLDAALIAVSKPGGLLHGLCRPVPLVEKAAKSAGKGEVIPSVMPWIVWPAQSGDGKGEYWKKDSWKDNSKGMCACLAP